MYLIYWPRRDEQLSWSQLSQLIRFILLKDIMLLLECSGKDSNKGRFFLLITSLVHDPLSQHAALTLIGNEEACLVSRSVYNVLDQHNHKLSWFGHVCRYMLRCWKPYHIERWKVVIAKEDRVNHWRATSRNGLASHCRRRCTSQTALNQWATTIAEASIGVQQWHLCVTGI